MTIYCITNKVNGKKYVGQTVKTLAERWRRHCWASEANKRMAIGLAIKKYGKENFKIEILCECSTLEELSQSECDYIKRLNTLAPNGYNLTEGGERPNFTPEVRAKISAAHKGRHASKATRLKLRKAGLGRKFPQDRIDRMRNCRIGKKPCSLALTNSILTNQKTYKLVSPSGDEVQITNMSRFCKSNDLNKFKMCEVVNHKRQDHKGWSVQPERDRK
jgi:group I intron endonuclease